MVPGYPGVRIALHSSNQNKVRSFNDMKLPRIMWYQFWGSYRKEKQKCK